MVAAGSLDSGAGAWYFKGAAQKPAALRNLSVIFALLNLSVAGAAATAPLVGEPLAEDLFFAMIAGAPKPMPAAGQTGAKR